VFSIRVCVDKHQFRASQWTVLHASFMYSFQSDIKIFLPTSEVNRGVSKLWSGKMCQAH